MIILTERKTSKSTVKAIYQEGLLNFKEANNLPVVSKLGGVSTNPKITSVVRQDTIFNTLQAMGLKPYVNKLNNIVAEVQDPATGSAVASTIYQQFGVKCSFVIPWDGSGMKLYWAPDATVDRNIALAYANTAGLPPPNPRKYLV